MHDHVASTLQEGPTQPQRRRPATAVTAASPASDNFTGIKHPPSRRAEPSRDNLCRARGAGKKSTSLLSVGLAVRPAAGLSLCNEREEKPVHRNLHADRRRLNTELAGGTPCPSRRFHLRRILSSRARA